MPERLHLLHYVYVENVVDKRAPHRDAHLQHIAAWKESGRLRTAGAVGDPPHGALFVFSAETGLREIETFASDDPYVHAGLVTARRVEPWMVV
jgi:uncharacterized protein YciI